MKYSDNKHVENDPTLIIYCKEWCEYLRKLVNLLREKQQSFTFIDLRFDTQQAKRLISELGNPLILPVLSFEGLNHEKPPISKVATILDRKALEETIDEKYYGAIPSEAD